MRGIINKILMNVEGHLQAGQHLVKSDTQLFQFIILSRLRHSQVQVVGFNSFSVFGDFTHGHKHKAGKPTANDKH